MGLDRRTLLRPPPVRAEYRPTLPELIAPRIDSLPRIVGRILVAVALVVVVVIVALVLRLHDPVYTHSGPPASFTTSYSRAMTLERTPHGWPFELRENSSVGLAASFEIQTLHLPRYRGEISGLLPVVAAGMISHLEATEPSFVLWSQGRTRIRTTPGYTFTFQRTIDGRPYWGRYVLITPQISGDREGLLITMLTDPALLASAKAPITPDSVGSVGVLFEPLERLNFS
jgi:hypothetical protein